MSQKQQEWIDLQRKHLKELAEMAGLPAELLMPGSGEATPTDE